MCARALVHGSWLINPSSAAMQYWDFVVLFAMAFTCTITPYEVCMLWQDQGFDTLFYINIVINLIFVVDTTFQFFLPYKLPLKVGGGLIKNHKKIALHYLESWFIIDFISIFPIDYILAGVTVDASNVRQPRAPGARRHARPSLRPHPAPAPEARPRGPSQGSPTPQPVRPLPRLCPRSLSHICTCICICPSRSPLLPTHHCSWAC